MGRSIFGGTDTLGTLVLAVLNKESLHGYAIAQRLKSLSGEQFNAGEGTLYPALRQLEAEGHIESEWITPEAGAARRCYTLTDRGQLELESRRNKWFERSSAFSNILNGAWQDA